MATGGGLALPEHLQDEDARSWFKRFEVCAAANGWDNAKKLLRLPTLLRGRAWAVYDSLDEESTDTYAHLKSALLQGHSNWIISFPLTARIPTLHPHVF